MTSSKQAGYRAVSAKNKPVKPGDGRKRPGPVKPSPKGGGMWMGIPEGPQRGGGGGGVFEANPAPKKSLKVPGKPIGPKPKPGKKPITNPVVGRKRA